MTAQTHKGKICVSVLATTADELVRNINKAARVGDVVEVRFDHLAPNEVDHSVAILTESPSSTPLIATFRPLSQGGKRELTIDERINFWKRFADRFWRVDLEKDISDFFEHLDNRICSHHDFNETAGDLEVEYSNLSSCDCEVLKIAKSVGDATDAIPLWQLLNKALEEEVELVPIAMGEAGKWTRILGLAHGACLTYASLDDDSQLAPGQITATDLNDLYRVKSLDLDTRVYGIIGGSTSSAMSPFIQNAAFKAAGLNSVLIPFQIKDVGKFMRRMVNPKTREIELNLYGFAVTIPHKQAIMEYLDEIDDTAKAVGAVNTIDIREGIVRGSNTDVIGFLEPLKRRIPDLREVRVALAGAGGAARACAHALRSEGANVTVFARDRVKAERLALEMSVQSGELIIEAERPATNFSGFDILINATPIGMKGHLNGKTIAVADQIRNCRLVYDLVGNPRVTKLISEAQIADVPSIAGLEMLIAQGTRQFELWTGQTAPVDTMREAAIARLS
jgi:3-dehydroquinate dehydratase/shikimate dehydrogenase